MTVLRKPLLNGPGLEDVLDQDTIQKLNAKGVSDLSGDVVRVTDQHYTVTARDRIIVLAATTSVADWDLIFPDDDTVRDGQVIDVVLPNALGGTDSFQTSGLNPADAELDAAGDNLKVVRLKDEGLWQVLVDGVA